MVPTGKSGGILSASIEAGGRTARLVVRWREISPLAGWNRAAASDVGIMRAGDSSARVNIAENDPRPRDLRIVYREGRS
jgi:hypothetical protein